MSELFCALHDPHLQLVVGTLELVRDPFGIGQITDYFCITDQ